MLAATPHRASTAVPPTAYRGPPSRRRAKLKMRGMMRLNLAHPIIRVRGTQASAQLGAQLFGDAHGIDTVAHNLRPDEDDEFGALRDLAVGAEQLAELAELIDQRQTAAAVLGPLADQAGEQHCLAARDRD